MNFIFLIVVASLAGCCSSFSLPKLSTLKVQQQQIFKTTASICLGIAASSFLASPSYAESSVFIGSYRDSAHPGCSRKVSYDKDKISLVITGSDHTNGAGKWAIRASEVSDSSSILVDFSNGILAQDWHSPGSDFPLSFGGTTDVRGVYDAKLNGIKWADGDTWIKTSVAQSLVSGSGSGFTNAASK